VTWIKICGTTNLEDAQLAAEAGADALGFIFAPSPRQIDRSRAKEIIRVLPKGIVRVGVFVNESLETMTQTVTEVGLNTIQVHGDRPPIPTSLKAVEEALGHERGIIMAIPGEKLSGDFMLSGGFALPNRAVLLDNAAPDSSGGTGKRFDWSTVARNVRLMSDHFDLKFIIAGGLTPENVGEAIRLFRPWGVDVVSGVEAKPGKKDPKKLRAFIQAVRELDKVT